MLLLRARALGACSLLLVLTLVRAHAEGDTDINASPGLTLGQAVERALAGNPALKGFAFALKAEEARIAQARQSPATEATFELENVLGSGDFGGLDAAEATFALSQVIELGDKRRLRSATAESGRDVVTVERQAAQLDVLVEVTRRFIAVAAAQERVALAGKGTKLAKETADDVGLRVRSARSPEGELLRARAALSRAGLAEASARSELGAARQALAAMWSSGRPDYSAVRVDLFRFPAVLDFEALAARLDSNPDFLRFASEARLRDAEFRLATSLAKPDLAVSGGVRRLEETDDQALVLGISVPLFAGRRSVPVVAEASARRELLAVERDAARLQARTQLYGLHEQLRQAIHATEILRGEVVPQLEAALKGTAYAYERGRYGYLELADAQRELLEAQAAAIESAAAGQVLIAEIERLTGEPVVETNVLEQP